jgi:hypothetical protein
MGAEKLFIPASSIGIALLSELGSNRLTVNKQKVITHPSNNNPHRKGAKAQSCLAALTSR